MNMKFGLFLLILINSSAAVFLFGCAEERTEYHYRSQAEADAIGRPVDETFVKADGTKVVYSSKRREKISGNTPSGTDGSSTPDLEKPPVDLREKKANGEVILRATFPEQVVDHLTECVRNEEYDLIWNQLLSTGAKRDLESRGGIKYFKTFFTNNRKEVMATLNCMRINLKNGHVALQKTDDSHMTAELDSTLRRSYKFTVIDFESTPTGMKLVGIR